MKEAFVKSIVIHNVVFVLPAWVPGIFTLVSGPCFLNIIYKNRIQYRDAISSLKCMPFIGAELVSCRRNAFLSKSICLSIRLHQFFPDNGVEGFENIQAVEI